MKVQQAAVLVLAAVGFLWFMGIGPFEVSIDGGSSPIRAEQEPASDSATTTTEVVLAGRSYLPGDCLIWDQDEGYASERHVRVVPCSEMHLMEVTGSERLGWKGRAYPTEDEWTAAIEEQCQPNVAARVGWPLDELAYRVTALHPLEASWRMGDRQLWCGVASAGTFEAWTGKSAPIRGRVDSRYLLPLPPAGSCVDEWEVVDCSAPHEAEVVGHATIPSGLAALPAQEDPDSWSDLVGKECAAQAQPRVAGAAARAGRDPGSAYPAWLPISQRSYDAGRRTTVCLLAFESPSRREASA